MNTVHWEPSCSMRKDRWTYGRTDTDITKLIVAFYNFTDASKYIVLYMQDVLCSGIEHI